MAEYAEGTKKMNDKDFLKGMIIGKMISDYQKNEGGGGSPGGGGCFTVIGIALLIIFILALFRSCG